MEQPDYFTTAAALKNLSPLNDSCERALALAVSAFFKYVMQFNVMLYSCQRIQRILRF